MSDNSENVVEDRARGGKARDTTSVVAETGRYFVSVGRHYYFKDGALAFTDHGTKLTTRSGNTEVVRTLVGIAAARKWQAITVSGSDTFRRDAWREARTLGLEVEGYKASEVEEANVRLRREFSATYGRRREDPDASRVSDAARPIANARGLSPQDPRNPNAAPLFRGTLTEFGPAKFGFDEEAQPSFYLRIKTSDGQRTIWGKDLQRAIAESMSQPKIGDEVGVHPVSRQTVRVRTVERNAEGAAIGEKVKPVHRNQWVVEKLEFFAERAKAAAALRDEKVEPVAVVSRHPLLRDAYLALRVAELAAEKKMVIPENRQLFVKEVRERLAKMLEDGTPLPQVRLRARSRSADERGREPLEADRTR